MGESYEYLVRGAQLKCDAGSKIMKLGVPTCHGVYAGQGAVIHQKDCVVGENILSFGNCKNKKNEPCTPIIVGDWMSTNNKTMIVQNGSTTAYPSVTMNSFLVCNLGGMIEPVKSGQVLSGGVTQVSYNIGDLLAKRIDSVWKEFQSDIKKAVVAIAELMEANSLYDILSLETLKRTKFDYWAVTADLSLMGVIGGGGGIILDRHANAYYTKTLSAGASLSPSPSGSIGFGTLPSKKGEKSEDYVRALEGISETLSMEVFALAVQESFDINLDDIRLSKWVGNQFVFTPAIGVSASISECIYAGNILDYRKRIKDNYERWINFV